MPLDFVVVSDRWTHVGSPERTDFGPFRIEGPPGPGHIDHVGTTADFTFFCPGLDVEEPGLLLLQTRSIDHHRNHVEVNGRHLPGALFVTASNSDWSTSTAIIPPDTLLWAPRDLPETGRGANHLTIQTRDPLGGSYHEESDNDSWLRDFLEWVRDILPWTEEERNVDEFMVANVVVVFKTT